MHRFYRAYAFEWVHSAVKAEKRKRQEGDDDGGGGGGDEEPAASPSSFALISTNAIKDILLALPTLEIQQQLINLKQSREVRKQVEYAERNTDLWLQIFERYFGRVGDAERQAVRQLIDTNKAPDNGYAWRSYTKERIEAIKEYLLHFRALAMAEYDGDFLSAIRPYFDMNSYPAVMPAVVYRYSTLWRELTEWRFTRIDRLPAYVRAAMDRGEIENNGMLWYYVYRDLDAFRKDVLVTAEALLNGLERYTLERQPWTDSTSYGRDSTSHMYDSQSSGVFQEMDFHVNIHSEEFGVDIVEAAEIEDASKSTIIYSFHGYGEDKEEEDESFVVLSYDVRHPLSESELEQEEKEMEEGGDPWALDALLKLKVNVARLSTDEVDRLFEDYTFKL